MRSRWPRAGLLLPVLVVGEMVVHLAAPLFTAPPGGAFPTGLFQMQSAVSGTCVGVVPGSRPSPTYRIRPVAMSACGLVPEQTWRYDRSRHRLLVTLEGEASCAALGISTVEVNRCSSTLGGLRSQDEQWFLTDQGAITGGDLGGTLGQLVFGIPNRGCWQAGTDVEVRTCRDDVAQRWHVLPVPAHG